MLKAKQFRSKIIKLPIISIACAQSVCISSSTSSSSLSSSILMFSKYFTLILCISIHLALVSCEIRYDDNSLNSLDDSKRNSLYQNQQKGSESYLVKNDEFSVKNEPAKCEIKVITQGNCFVGEKKLLVKPRISLENVGFDHPLFSRYNKKPKKLSFVERMMHRREMKKAQQEEILKKLQMKKQEQELEESNKNQQEKKDNMNEDVIETKTANQIVDEFLSIIRKDYANQIDPFVMERIEPIQIDNWGVAKLHSLTLSGLANIYRSGSSQVNQTDGESKNTLISGHLSISNMIAHFKVDAKLIDRVFVRGWKLTSTIGNVLLRFTILLDSTSQTLTVDELTVEAIDGLRIKTEQLAWPFNQVIHQILNSQKHFFERVIIENAGVYMREALKKIDLAEIIRRMKTKM